ncbi:MAG: UTP--glucose-1-phosphate uridylyltransferase [Patescibacteria group bacterium]
MRKIRKVIIPAAGLGTRFLPATKSQAKEMLPIVDKPCIQYLVEEAVASGIKEIIIITAEGKRSIEDHFKFSKKLSTHLKANNKTEALKEMERIEKLAKFTYVKQPKPLGDGHAILCAAHLIKNEPFAVLFGDDIYDSKVPALKQLIQQFQKFSSPIIALHKIDKKDSKKYGIVEVEKKNFAKQNFLLHKIKNLVEKPASQKAPSNLAIAGKYIITPQLLKALKACQKSKNKELRLIDGMKNFVKHSAIYGYEVEGKRFDTGDKLGYLKAVVHFALKHKDLKKNFSTYIRKVLKP